MTNNQKIMMTHEVRMWITDVIVPAVIAVAVIDHTHPEIKDKITGIFHKN